MADEDLYALLGVPRDAKPDAIKRAWRDLARRLHPDRNPDDEDAQARFQEVAAAWAILSDPDKRLVYDTFGLSAVREGWTEELAAAVRAQRPGQKKTAPEPVRAAPAQPASGRSARRRHRGRERVDSSVHVEAGTRWDPARAARSSPVVRPQDARAEVVLDLREVATGGTREVLLQERGPCPGCGGTGKRPSGRFCSRCQGQGVGTFERAVEVSIPISVPSGATLRLRGEALPGPDGRRGDLYVTVTVRPDPVFRRQGLDLHVDVPISRALATRGGTIEVPTLDGTAFLEVPAGTTTGRRRRLRGHGLPGPEGRSPGDLYARIVVNG